ncbi:MAG: hypothetical protein U1F43_29830 [Myxococcota bacterium]
MLAWGTLSMEMRDVTNPEMKTARDLGLDTRAGLLPGALAIALLAGAISLGSACGGSDPDGNSGGDAYRSEAQPMKLDDLTTGELSLDAGDQTDWKSVEITDAGKVTIELSTDKKGAAVLVGVYDKYGALVDSDTKKGGSEDPVKVKFKAAEGRYFVKIQHKGGPKTTYSVQASMGNGGGGGPVPDI